MTNKRITKEKDNRKLTEKHKRGGHCPQYPSFSFRYLTDNKRYNFNYLTDSGTKGAVFESLSTRLAEITLKSWREWLQDRKSTGCEVLKFDQMRFIAKAMLTPDENIYVFRVKTTNGNDGRIIGYRQDACPTYYIIGFDFDYSAYDHGKY